MDITYAHKQIFFKVFFLQLNMSTYPLITFQVDEEEYQRLGLRPRHAYSVLDVAELPDAGGGPPTRLLRLRNPWGHYTWRGAWAAGCARWTPAARAALTQHHHDKDQGVFWISFDDVLKLVVVLFLLWKVFGFVLM